ncbi:MAG: carbon-nitrogen family hydrolase [Candidatus Altiarchaeum hamiconexum]|uniref:Carbon-nitrogen family hydrolase n=1 Tax=Candidatus Altarchaeum hamiconexum TaxID=1803513 RepID=A0A8J7YV08_9ARCH|nr:carbon-nitrogen family hydrolase [Candidatus Altarchaeum hamiconexum]OIQ05547.1 MAG: hypothetical protein AUK59_03470 [Candidatus Altarchaeum sp. CG2_30_32_3053]PIN67745.1 MAG: carbon-nitrogen hydrolase [Candidatus Altarchaeum sp. CG12_big_fil_rev_8_21_14_0_65_33_22]PIV27227.1 MAG: carbon-nitrogen hydrolase [Candidatus Altarchaeum sp. CG03_land_8_20_14_0_80_32_618]PIX48465.1 MAG: carbon-nitrogen hydrolase [Candidatus Altarchaeum sp. CG_4_8_14_3_um_filter_33_2054]PIZ31795.1 MAG: carbon-nitro
MQQNLKISAIQMNITNEVDINLMTAKEMIEKCEEDIVCLPELFSTGFRQDAINFAEGENGRAFKFIKEISAKRKILLIGGITEKDKGNLPYNAAVVFENGNFIGKYRKIHLFRHCNEHLYYSAGDKVFTCDFNKGEFKTKIGLMICYDLRFPEIAREIMKQDAEIIFVPANFPVQRKNHWKALLKARAIENLCYVVGVNANEIHNKYIEGKFGNSVCYNPWGNSVKRKLQNLDNGTIFEFEINIEKERAIRKNFIN